jgi:hypothetical protein
MFKKEFGEDGGYLGQNDMENEQLMQTLSKFMIEFRPAN